MRERARRDGRRIRTHVPDMLRVAVRFGLGRITASTILRRLGTYSRKNRLYLAFRELGRVVRTGFLLRYLAEQELRATIQAATNKSEQFNRFLKWVFFGGEGVITENSRDEQRKVIKYNHFVANCLIFHNVCSLTRVISHLQDEGEDVPETAVARISPYLTEHIDRFGDYVLNVGVSDTVEAKPRSPEALAELLVDPDAAHARRQRAERRDEVPRAQQVRRVASLVQTTPGVMELIKADAERRDPQHRQPLVVLRAGALCLWSLATQLFKEWKHVTCVSDIMHVVSYVWTAANALFQEGSQGGKRWVKQKLTELLRCSTAPHAIHHPVNLA